MLRASRSMHLPVSATVVLVGSLTLLCGCHIDMWQQPKDKPQSENALFPDLMGSRPLAIGTVARTEPYHQLWGANPALSDDIRFDNPFYTGVSNGRLVSKIPDEAFKSFPSLRAMLLRGQDRFKIFCSPCHSRLGDGQGMIAQRGFALRRQPADYHSDRLMKMPIGHFFDVITNGYGAMYPYAARVQPVDRWAIAAYIRVLQFSQDAHARDVPPDILQQLEQPGVTTVPSPEPRSDPDD